jgi:carbamoyltransferase
MFLLSQSTHRMIIRHHPRIGHLFVPNLNARIPNELGGYYVRTNALGFRSDVEFTPRRGDRPRILFFGDSITAADGCSNHERFAELTGEALGAEVFNYGLSGSGTDQQLLIFEEFAKDVEADLIVLAVFVENIERIKVIYRESIDRVTRQHVLVPKPYFTLAGDDLQLHNVPVPLERPMVGAVGEDRYQAKVPSRLKQIFRLLDVYRNDPRLAGFRRFANKRLPGLRSQILRQAGFQPYPDYKTPTRGAWPLLRAIITRFLAEARPVPVLIVPIPSYLHFYDDIDPIYQGVFADLADPQRGVHVMDLTTPLRQRPRSERRRLVFQHDKTHFSPEGHRVVAGLLADAIATRGLLPARPPAPRPVPTAPQSNGHAPSASDKPHYILGVSCFYHNSAAALIKDGEIVAAAEEERFSRVKNDRRFPHFAANYCLEEGGIQQHDLAAVVYYDNAPLTFERLVHTIAAVGPEGEDAWARAMPSWVQYKLHLPQLIRRYLKYDGLVLHELHHRSHAASAFYPSPFQRAAILTIDGVGEWATASIGVGHGGRIQLLKEMRFPHSLGLLYSAFTQFTGFKVNSGEYKMMGLAPYGEPKYVDTITEHLVHLKDDGSIELNLEYFAYLSHQTMTNERFAELFGGPARKPDERITQREMDLARSVQVVTEDVMLRMARHAHALTGERSLCLSGGVALNCVANGRILREGPFENMWIQPAAGDSGSALGAALDAYHNYFDRPRVRRTNGRSLQGASTCGPAFSGNEIAGFLDTHGYPYRVLARAERAQTIARMLDEGKVVGHFCGRTEFGPRALGARSILGDARNREMQVNLNLKIKYRESFRPFAPSVLEERVAEYFELDRESPYMLLVAPVRETHRAPCERVDGTDLLAIVRQPRSDIPAITHVDYSARIQTVTHSDSPEYYEVIHAFEERTGCAVIVNTSFNVRGEPIVCTPYDAYRCFMRTEMDVLVLGDYLLIKGEQPAWPEPKGHVESDDAETSRPASDAAEPLAKALREVYTRVFAATAERLRRGGQLKLTTDLQRRPTMWVDCAASESPREVFAIPSALDDPTPEPEQMAEAITRFWTPGAATDAFKPVVASLLALGRRFPRGETLNEEVSESIYVMF